MTDIEMNFTFGESNEKLQKFNTLCIKVLKITRMTFTALTSDGHRRSQMKMAFSRVLFSEFINLQSLSFSS